MLEYIGGILMLLSALLENAEVLSQYSDCEIYDVKSDTDEVFIGCAFVCIKGSNVDSHIYAKTAIKNGAIAIICERDLGLKNQVVVSDTRKCFALMCKNLFEKAADNMKLVATTGTNGKTSVTTIINKIISDAGVSSGIISTIQAQYKDFIQELDNTTPESHTLHFLFKQMKDRGCEAVCMEASSHALDQKRLDFCNFEIAIFTNLTQDHLDYHSTMEEYYYAKKRLFSMSKYAVINIDNEYGIRLKNEIEIPYCTYSISQPDADFYADEIICTNDGVSFMLHHNQIQTRVKFAIPGLYSVQNALAASAAAFKMGISFKNIVESLSQIEIIKGRSEIIKTNKEFNLICDFAHTPDGLENILKTTKQYCKGRLVVLFGCGGDRDRDKRPQMGKIAADYADFIILTSDNPRTENPERIINEVIRGIPNSAKYIAITQRSTAIRYALATAKKGDTIILAGKGHEQYQVIGDKKLYFDERKVVEGCLKSLEQS